MRFWFDDDDPERRARVSRQRDRHRARHDDGRGAHRARVRRRRCPSCCSTSATRRSSPSASSACGRSRTSRSPTRCCASRSAGATYLIASLTNVLLTVALTFTLVVVLDSGARGYVAGNYVASTVVLFGLWWLRARPLRASSVRGLRRRCCASARRRSRPTWRSSRSTSSTAPTCCSRRAQAAAGVYAVSVKLATAVIVAVRGFQLAWPPLAYSIADDDEARRFYARGHDVVRRRHRARRRRHDAARPLARAAARRAGVLRGARGAAVGRARLGAVTACSSCSSSIAGRAKVTIHQLPAALAGLAVNVVLLVAARRPARHRRRGHRAGRRPTWRCSRCSACSRGARSRCRSSAGGSPTRSCVSPASRSPASCCCRPTASPGSLLRALVLALIPLALWLTRFPTAARAGGRGGAAASRAALNASAASRMPSPRPGRSVAVTWRAYRRGSWPGRTSAASARSA